LIAGPENVARKPKGRGKEKDADHMLDDLASMNRPADPHLTNAPVLTPNGSQVVVNDSPARKRKAAELPPDVGSPLKPANSTIETLLKDAEAYLINVDETGRLEKLIEKHHCKLFSPDGLREVVDPFTALASGIIGQQVCFPHHHAHEQNQTSTRWVEVGWTAYRRAISESSFTVPTTLN
jgi:DNA-3-methyladenine glycosylase II